MVSLKSHQRSRWFCEQYLYIDLYIETTWITGCVYCKVILMLSVLRLAIMYIHLCTLCDAYMLCIFSVWFIYVIHVPWVNLRNGIFRLHEKCMFISKNAWFQSGCSILYFASTTKIIFEGFTCVLVLSLLFRDILVSK